MLVGRVFHILTDHRPLTQALLRKAEPWSPRQTRQLSYISEYTSDVRYIAGPSNTVADALSRDVFEELNSVTFCTLEEFATAQQRCKDVQALRNAPSLSCSSKRLPSGKLLHFDNSTGKPRIIVPVSLRQKVVEHMHSIHHPGIRSTRRLVSARFVWGRLARDVKEVVDNCHECHAVKTPRKLAPPPAQLPTPARRFNCVHLDIVGPLPESHGMRYMLTMVDRTTRWLEAVPLASIDADTVTSTFLNHWVSRFGIPADVVSDRGLQFTSRTFSSSLQAMGSRVHTTTSYHPQSNGLVERAHRRLKEALSARGGQWTQNLPWVLMGLRNTPREDDDISPAQMLYGTSCTFPGSIIDSPEYTSQDLLDAFRQLKSGLPVRPPAAPSAPRSIPDLRWVYVKVDSVKPPLHPKYQGPFEVVSQTRNTVRIRIGDDIELVNLSRAKLF